MADRWVIEEQANGKFDVKLDGKPVVYDEATVEEALYVVRARGGRGATFVHVDGYKEKLF